METIDFKFPFEIVKTYEEGKKEEKDTSKWIVEGYAGSTAFDLQADIITSDAFKKAEKDLLKNSTVLENHDLNKRIGKVIASKAQKEGLWVKVLISKTAKDIWQQIKEGVLNKFSIRGRVIDAIKQYVKKIGRIANVINRMELVECSLVSIPANPEAKTMRWYISKSIKDFEKKGGEIPLSKELKKQEKKEEPAVKKEFDLATAALTLESMIDRLSEEDKKSISAIVTSMKKKAEEPKAEEPKKVEKKEEPKAEESKKVEEPVVKAEKPKVEKEVKKEEPKPEKEEIKIEFSKKKEGNYSQEEVETILAKVKTSISEHFKGLLSKKDKALIDLKEEIMRKLETSEEKNNELKVENDSLKANQKVEEEWNKIGDSFKEEDAEKIKGILKKTFLNQPLKPEETTMLIEKKVVNSDIVISNETPHEIGELTPERKAEIINFSGIKTRVKS